MIWAAEALKQELIKPWRHGEYLNARGSRIESALELQGAIIRSFDLSDSEFKDDIIASAATFVGMAWLHRTRVIGKVDLSGGSFHNDLRLDGLICDMLDLSHCRFEGVLSLDQAQIGTLMLNNSLCLTNLSLAGIHVNRMFSLENAEVMGGIWQKNAIVHNQNKDGCIVFGRS